MPVTAAVAAAVAVAAAGALVVVVLLLIRIVADDIVPLCVARCLFTVEDVFTAAKPSRTASAPEFQQIEDSGSLHCHSAVTPTVTRSTE